MPFAESRERPRFKICCIRDEAELALAVSAGASAVGLVSTMPSGPGVVDDASIRRLARVAPPGVATFLLTSLTDPDEIASQARAAGTSVLQLVDRVAAGVHEALRERLPNVKLVQVVHVVGSASIEEALHAAQTADALLLDSGNPSLSVKELGGTGRTHDWSVSRVIRERAIIPVFLAGGLRPDNVRAAIDAVAPFAVDVCTGVRTNGALDPVKLGAFVREIQQ